MRYGIYLNEFEKSFLRSDDSGRATTQALRHNPWGQVRRVITSVGVAVRKN